MSVNRLFNGYAFSSPVISTLNESATDIDKYKEYSMTSIASFKRSLELFLSEIADYYKCHIDSIEYNTSEELEIVIKIKRKFLDKCKYEEVEKAMTNDINTLIEIHDLKIPVKLKVVHVK
ncbi:MAG: hypothetical protein QXS23_05500 [Desulfurococcaceae archaeon]